MALFEQQVILELTRLTRNSARFSIGSCFWRTFFVKAGYVAGPYTLRDGNVALSGYTVCCAYLTASLYREDIQPKYPSVLFANKGILIAIILKWLICHIWLHAKVTVDTWGQVYLFGFLYFHFIVSEHNFVLLERHIPLFLPFSMYSKHLLLTSYLGLQPK